MDFNELAASRRSIRKFEACDVSEESVMKLLEAAQSAPSAGNCQPWHFFVVRDEEMRRHLAVRAYDCDWVLGAPVIIVVCTEEARTTARYFERGRELYCLQDTAAAIQNILLSAKAQGLGTCWIGAFSEEICRQTLSMDEGLRPVAMIPVGYPAHEPWPRPRRPIEEIATFL